MIRLRFLVLYWVMDVEDRRGGIWNCFNFVRIRVFGRLEYDLFEVFKGGGRCKDCLIRLRFYLISEYYF